MTFVGRDHELQALICAWQAAKTGAPQILVLAGESRIGKTRLVQQFYSWLNQHEDPANYWPDNLETGNDSLQLNPRLDAADAQNVPPWLWWGLRWQKPDTRNMAPAAFCGLLGQLGPLDLVFDKLRRQRAAANANREALLKLGAVAANLATAGASDAVATITDLLRSWHDVRRARVPAPTTAAAGVQALVADELVRLRGLLVELMTTDALVPGGLPLIVVLDDVHWADRASLTFVRQLLDEARSARLLIVATTWEREWEESLAASRTSGPPSEARSLADVIAHFGHALDGNARARPALTQLTLGPIRTGLEALASGMLPGLTPGQQQLIVERAGGSPGLLTEIILKLRRSPFLFRASDVSRELTQVGEARLRGMVVAYHELVEERLSQLEPACALALRVASFVGLSYSHTAVIAIVRRLELDGISESIAHRLDALLARADHPLALVQSVGDGIQEFRLPIYHEVLRSQLELDEATLSCLSRNVCSVVRELLESRFIATRTEREQEVLVDFAIRALQPPGQGVEGTASTQARRKAWCEKVGQAFDRGDAAALHLAFDQVLASGHDWDETDVADLGPRSLSFLLRAATVLRRTEMQALVARLLTLCATDGNDEDAAVSEAALRVYHAEAAARSLHTPDGGAPASNQIDATVAELQEAQRAVRRVNLRFGTTIERLRWLASALESEKHIRTLFRHEEALEQIREAEAVDQEVRKLRGYDDPAPSAAAEHRTPMNIGLVVNANGKLCMAHDEPFPATPLWVGYHTDKRQLVVVFDTGGTYPVHWDAPDDIHWYLMSVKKILIIRMEDRQPVEGYDTSLLRLRKDKVVD